MAETPVTPSTAAQTVPAKPLVSIAAGVNAAVAKTAPLPKGLTLFNTKDLLTNKTFFHGCIYGETSTRRSTVSAKFFGVDNTRIVLTRQKEQLIPLQEMGYKVAQVEDAAALQYAMLYPEKLWPEWANLPERALVLDDGTMAVEMLLEANETIDGKEVRDRRRTYDAAGQDLREIMRAARRKPQHLILIATAKVRENPITNEERVGPELPPSMLSFLLAELEYCFYVKPSNWKFITDRDFFTFEDFDDKGNKRTYRREIFAKNKLSQAAATRGVLLKEEPMDLAAIWKKVREAK